jgi:uncharacterized protein
VDHAHTLAPDERRELLRIARATVREYLDSGRIPPGKPHRASLLANASVQVTLYRDDALLSSAATGGEERPLYRAVQEVAVEALTKGGLDAEMTDDDLTAISIEIGVDGPDGPQVFRDPARAT